jgi:acyl dehydratase
VIADEVMEYIGKADEPHIRTVEKGAIRRYAAAVGNDNPLYSDEEYARSSAYGCIIAPPGFFGWPTKPASSAVGLANVVVDLQAELARAGYPRILDGGISYEFHLPVRAGDILSVSPKITGISEKEGKSGTMIMCSLETSYLNQNGDLVAVARQTFIAR